MHLVEEVSIERKLLSGRQSPQIGQIVQAALAVLFSLGIQVFQFESYDRKIIS